MNDRDKHDENPFSSTANSHLASSSEDMATGEGSRWKSLIKYGIAEQFIVGSMALLALDTGTMSRACLVAAVAFWVMCALIAFRRLERITTGDRFLIRWGFLIIFAAVLVYMHIRNVS